MALVSHIKMKRRVSRFGNVVSNLLIVGYKKVFEKISKFEWRQSAKPTCDEFLNVQIFAGVKRQK